MKKTLILSLTVLFSSLVYAQDCNIGNEDSTVLKDGTPFSADFILGTKHSLAKAGILKSINVLSKNNGDQIQMAVYSDSSGVPKKLLADGGIATLKLGVNSFTVTQTQLAAGDYWIMAVYDKSGDMAYKGAVDNTKTYFGDHSFGRPLPTNISHYTSYGGQQLGYFLEIKCGTLSNVTLESTEEPTVYPNPATDLVHIAKLNAGSASKITILDACGRQVKEEITREAEIDIDISSLSAGTYSVMQNGQYISKLVKQ